MTITLDTVLTVAIGRNGQDGRPLTDSLWAGFQRQVLDLLKGEGTVVCHALSVSAVGSDGVNEGVEEDSAVFIAVNVRNEEVVRATLSNLLGAYGQTSACFAMDHFHEPAFAGTIDGYRPRLSPVMASLDREVRQSRREQYASLEAALNDGFARRTHG